MSREVGRPVIFGEVLFDCFDDGSAVLGGAPFNVAWHLHGFGLHPLLLSRVGNDAEGEQVLAQMQAWGMECSGMQTDESRPTGSVQISLHDGQPTFDILSDQAYDFIQLDQLEHLLQTSEIALFYHGTLALRNEASRHAFFQLLNSHPFPVFTDINLRAPWWQKDLVHASLAQARWAKLNNDELCEITGQHADNEDALVRLAQKFFEASGLKLLILTLGAEGAYLFSEHGRVHDRPQAIEQIQDTVGAGDAFSSVCIAGLLKQWPHDLILQRALAFAAEICQIRGATVPDRGLYSTYRQEWEL